MDIGFALNYTNIYMIQLPDSPWARIGAGITGVEPDGKEETSSDAYYDGGGMSSTDVTGGQQQLKFTGHRVYGDPAQDYIASLVLAYGEARKRPVRWVSPNGAVIEGIASIVNIKPGGGDANNKSDFGFEAHFDGRPNYTPGNASTFPATITAQDVTVPMGGTVAVNATATPTTAAQSFVYAVEDTEIALVDAAGTVKGLKAGETSLSVKSAVKPDVSAKVTVTVSAG
jgi:hypothetical protein